MGRGCGSQLHQGHAWHLQPEQQEQDMEGEHEKGLEMDVVGGERQQCRRTHQQSFLEQVEVLGPMEAGDRVPGPCHPRWGSLLVTRADLFAGICTPAPPLTSHSLYHSANPHCLLTPGQITSNCPISTLCRPLASPSASIRSLVS